MQIEHLLRELRDDTYVALRPSGVAGVGVFAVRDIPKGCRAMFSPPMNDDDSYIPVPRAEVEALPPHARQMVENYCLFDEDRYFVPKDGFKKMDLVSFLNHSENPNIASIDEGAYFEALRDIAADEELFVDYGTIVTE